VIGSGFSPSVCETAGLQSAGTMSSRRRTPGSLLLALAELVAAPGSLAALLTPDNRKGPRISLGGAVELGSAFFVRVDDAVLAVDFDHPDAEPQAVRLYWCCRLAGFPALLVASGQIGRRHVFSWPSTPEARAQLVSAAKELGGDVRASIRPPLAPHRLQSEGIAPALLKPDTPEAVLAHVRSRSSLKAWSPGMRRRVVDDPRKRYRTRSEYIRAVALAAANAGWCADEALELLTSACFPASEAYLSRAADKGEEETRTWFRKHVWPSAVLRLEQYPAVRIEPDPRLRDLRRSAATRVWRGRGGPSDRVVYLALLDKAYAFGETDVNASRRELMQLSGLRSGPTVEKALIRLQDAQLIERRARLEDTDRQLLADGTLQFRHSRKWRLLPGGEHLSVDASNPDDVAGVEVEALDHDAFQNGAGLGKNAHRVWEAVTRSPGADIPRLSAGLGLTTRTVRRHLDRLALFGLVERSGADHWFRVGRELDAVAADLGTLGNQKALREWHRRERETYDDHREEKLLNRLMDGHA
jgi:hypothetical protein